MGTIFVNTFSNILCTCYTDAHITLKPKQNVNIIEVIGYKKADDVPIGDIKYG